MQAFYTRLNQLLVKIELEESAIILGCSEDEIVAREQSYGIQFPLAYRLFLKWCGRKNPALFRQNFELEFLHYYWDSARDLLAENHAVLESGGFVFTEWQGYNFLYFLLGSDNPPVKQCIIKSDTEPGLEYMDYGRFTDWLIDYTKAAVNTLQFIGIDVDVLTIEAELEQIAQLGDQT
jgi:hypothetical protein